MKKTKFKKILINIGEDQDNELSRLAERSGRTKADLIREAIFLLIQAYRATEAELRREGDEDV